MHPIRIRELYGPNLRIAAELVHMKLRLFFMSLLARSLFLTSTKGPTMKRSLFAAFVILACCHAHAQLKGFSIGPYAETAWPTGDLAKTNKNGIGAGLNADIRLGKLGLTGSVGYMHFGGKTIATNEGPVNMPAINAVPIRAGLKYRFIPLLYFKLESGVANYTHNDGSAFILSPGIGLRLLGLDVQAKYEAWMKDRTSGFWGLKVGYSF